MTIIRSSFFLSTIEVVFILVHKLNHIWDKGLAFISLSELYRYLENNAMHYPVKGNVCIYLIEGCFFHDKLIAPMFLKNKGLLPLRKAKHGVGYCWSEPFI
jgi:hypothetical protein